MINGSVIGCQVELKIAEGEPKGARKLKTIGNPTDFSSRGKTEGNRIAHPVFFCGKSCPHKKIRMESNHQHVAITPVERFGFSFHGKYGIKIIDGSGNIRYQVLRCRG
jgi:hypothetical protein